MTCTKVGDAMTFIADSGNATSCDIRKQGRIGGEVYIGKDAVCCTVNAESSIKVLDAPSRASSSIDTRGGYFIRSKSEVVVVILLLATYLGS